MTSLSGTALSPPAPPPPSPPPGSSVTLVAPPWATALAAPPPWGPAPSAPASVAPAPPSPAGGGWRAALGAGRRPGGAGLTAAGAGLGAALGGLLGRDLRLVGLRRRRGRVRLRMAQGLLFSHVLSFYWALLGALRSLRPRGNILGHVALASLVGNAALCVGRIAFEYGTLQFRPESY